jgi:3-phosphoshikimate 1-carboxyvinyltransferase
MKATVYPSKLGGHVLIPGSKSHTIRALLIASFADGTSRITNYLDSADTRSCIDACRAFGADIAVEDDVLLVRGLKKDLLHARGADIDIDVGNSGTTLYLAAGFAALFNRTVRFTGDEQIRRRPFAPLLDSLTDLGAETNSVLGNGRAPAEVRGPLRGGETAIECPTSQYLSSLLLCAPLIKGDKKVYESATDLPKTVIHVPLLYEKPYVEISLRWLFKQGASFYRNGCERFEIPGNQEYKPFSAHIPGDFSSAAFFLCAAAVTSSEITLRGLDPEDPQGDKAVIDMLVEMGCSVKTMNEDNAGRPVILIRGPDRSKGETLKAAEIDMNATPDALPVMAVTACFADGITRLTNVPQARVKETDRIAVMARELAKMGAEIEELDDGLVIRGTGLRGAAVDGHGDHRVVMALAVAALGAEGKTVISTAEAAKITVPSFFPLLESLGAKIAYTGKAAAVSVI